MKNPLTQEQKASIEAAVMLLEKHLRQNDLMRLGLERESDGLRATIKTMRDVLDNKESTPEPRE